MATITSANSVFTIAIDPIYPSAVTLQGYGVDDAFSSESIEKTIMQIGVDGQPALAYVYRTTNITVNLQSNSPSVEIFNRWANVMDSIREALPCNAVIELPSLGKRYVLSIGALTGYTPVPTTTEYINDISFTITFAKVTVEKI